MTPTKSVIPDGTAVFCGMCGAALVLDSDHALERWDCNTHGTVVLLD